MSEVGGEEQVRLVGLPSPWLVTRMTHLYLAVHSYFFGAIGARSAGAGEEDHVRFVLNIVVRAFHPIKPRGAVQNLLTSARQLFLLFQTMVITNISLAEFDFKVISPDSTCPDMGHVIFLYFFGCCLFCLASPRILMYIKNVPSSPICTSFYLLLQGVFHTPNCMAHLFFLWPFPHTSSPLFPYVGSYTFFVQSLFPRHTFFPAYIPRLLSPTPPTLCLPVASSRKPFSQLQLQS